jgi:ankyrin repeat protein
MASKSILVVPRLHDEASLQALRGRSTTPATDLLVQNLDDVFVDMAEALESHFNLPLLEFLDVLRLAKGDKDDIINAEDDVVLLINLGPNVVELTASIRLMHNTLYVGDTLIYRKPKSGSIQLVVHARFGDAILLMYHRDVVGQDVGFEALPLENLVNIAKSLDAQGLENLCESSPVFNASLCGSTAALKALWRENISSTTNPRSTIAAELLTEYYAALSSDLRTALNKGYDKIANVLFASSDFMVVDELLIAASAGGNIDIIKRLLQAGANIYYHSLERVYDDTALSVAARNNHADVVKLLMNRDPPSETQLTDTIAKLIINSARPSLEILEYMLNALENNYGLASGVGKYIRYYLQLAANRYEFAVIKLLVQRYGTSIVDNNTYNELIRLAKETKQVELQRYLEESLQYRYTFDNIQRVMPRLRERIKYIEDAVSKGFPLSYNNYAILKNAAWYGAQDVIEYLIEHGVDVSVNDSHVLTDAIFSDAGNRYELAQYLISKGAKLDKQLHSILESAAHEGYTDVLDFLLSLGVDLSRYVDFLWKEASEGIEPITTLRWIQEFVKKRPNQRTLDQALLVSTQSGNKDNIPELLKAVTLLVNAGANPRYRDDRPLIYASENGMLPIVKYLVSQGSDPRAQNDLPLIYATKEGHKDVADYLISKGAERLS